MEEALVVQSLHREDGLTQMEIAILIGRDKSWVSRRISLIERLSEDVQEDIRLGLISVITGRELAKLPRGNQKEAAEAIFKRRYTTREATKLIGYLLSRPRWEYSAILTRPWEVVESRPSRPKGLGAKLIMFRDMPNRFGRLSRVVRKKREGVFSLIVLAAASAEEVKDLEGSPMQFIHNRQELEQALILMHHEGRSIRELCRQFHLGRNTVRRILRAHARRRNSGHDGLTKRLTRASKLDGFDPEIRKLLEKYPRITGLRIYEELKEAGYGGGISILRRLRNYGSLIENR
jgi:hypothetical protein